ncbi:hypothetical protein TNCV_4963511 [Trichonephila clavipes]|nr:hypothetical protein TNCV_4963511 [Trichonephila clavipes]
MVQNYEVRCQKALESLNSATLIFNHSLVYHAVSKVESDQRDVAGRLVSKHNVVSFRCPCPPFIAPFSTQTPVVSSQGFQPRTALADPTVAICDRSPQTSRTKEYSLPQLQVYKGRVEVDMPLRRFRTQYEQLFERGRITDMTEAGWSARRVARQLGCSGFVYLTTNATYCLLLRAKGGAYICIRAQDLLLRRGPGPQEVSRRPRFQVSDVQGQMWVQYLILPKGSGLSERRPLFGLPLTQNHRRLHRQWCDERRM